MSLELGELGRNRKRVYIILNPSRPPYILHSRSPSWDKVSINMLLKGYRVFRRVGNTYHETSKPFILVCGDGYSLYIPGKPVDKLRGGILTYTLVKSMLDGSLNGASQRSVEISIEGLNSDLLKALIMGLKPIVLVSELEDAEKLLRSIGVRIFYPEKLYTFYRLRRYLIERYRISYGADVMPTQKIDAVYGGRRLSICMGMYSGDCDLAVLEDISQLLNVNHISVYPSEDRLILKLFI